MRVPSLELRRSKSIVIEVGFIDNFSTCEKLKIV
jgi:hypothetical protein